MYELSIPSEVSFLKYFARLIWLNDSVAKFKNIASFPIQSKFGETKFPTPKEYVVNTFQNVETSCYTCSQMDYGIASVIL